MPPMNLSLPIGLSQSYDYEGRINDLHYNELAMKRVKDEQEAKAKMFADDTDYTNAMNSFDNPLVKQIAQAKIKEIGAFVNANPDWQTNVSKRIQYKQLTKDLRDNPDLNRGLATDKSYAELQKDMADAKNADVDFKPLQDQYANYLKYGNQFATDDVSAQKLGKQAFTYKTPAPDTNIIKELQEEAGKTTMNGFTSGGGFSKQFVTEPDKQRSAEALVANPYYAKKLVPMYKAYVAKQWGNEPTKAPDINQFTQELLEGHWPTPKIEQLRNESGHVGGNGKPPMEQRSLWNEAKQTAKANPNTQIPLAPARAQRILADPKGFTNLNDVELHVPGTDNRMKVSLGVSKNVDTSDSKIVYEGPPGKEVPYVTGTFTMPYKDVESMTGNQIVNDK